MKRVLIAFVLSTIALPLVAQEDSQEQYERILKEYFDENGPGATAIVTKGDEILYRGAVGYADIELGVTMRPEHIFRLGSITKYWINLMKKILPRQLFR